MPKLNKVVAHPSIWPRYIRDIKKSVISYPYDRDFKHGMFVICHELLHLYLFQYLNKNFKSPLKHIQKDDLYDFSEVFNAIIQQDKEWVRLTKLTAVPYPQHKQLFRLMRKDWEKSHDLDSLLYKHLFKKVLLS